MTRGQAVVEYALLVALLALVTLVALTLLGGSVSAVFFRLVDLTSDALHGACPTC